MSPTKILIIGPKGSGKSTIGTFLADIKDSLQPGKSYEPTYGVRILEKYNVEFYDCSGDQIFEGCWRSIMMGADGVIIVFNPDVPGHEQQLSEWYDLFVRKNGLSEDQCIIFAHRSQLSSERFRPPPIFSRVTAAVTGSESMVEVRKMVDSFLMDVRANRQKK